MALSRSRKQKPRPDGTQIVYSVLPTALVTAMDARAKEEERSASAVIRRALERYLRATRAAA